jgi:hypothetical protein
MIRAKKQAKRSTPRSAGAGFFGDPLHRLVERSRAGHGSFHLVFISSRSISLVWVKTKTQRPERRTP